MCLETSRWQLRWKENVQGRGRQSKVDWEEFKLEKSGECVLQERKRVGKRKVIRVDLHEMQMTGRV